jgi:hypothetical protein
MNCTRFEGWLDDGMPGGAETEACAHADRCPECAIALRAALEIEALLTGQPAPAPMGFADRVMTRVQAVGRPPVPAAEWAPLFALPWWVRAAADPASALAFIVAALFAWRIDWLSAVGALAARMASQASAIAPEAEAAFRLGADRPPLQLAFLLLGVPGILWGSFALYRWTERLTVRRGHTSHTN